MRTQEHQGDAGGPRKTQEDPGGTRRTQDDPGPRIKNHGFPGEKHNFLELAKSRYAVVEFDEN